MPLCKLGFNSSAKKITGVTASQRDANQFSSMNGEKRVLFKNILEGKTSHVSHNNGSKNVK